MMNQFYSSLVINSKKFPSVHQVFRPRYNKEYFKRITANIDALEEQIGKRCRSRTDSLSYDKLRLVRENAKQVVRLREQLELPKLEKDESKFKQDLAKLESIEERIIPTVIAIPNRSSRIVPEEDRLIAEVKSNFQQKQNLSKVLSHRKLSYINHCYTKSVVGPNSHYYFGIGAKLQYGLSGYFASKLEANNFIPSSGLCLVKSAVVEASNSLESKQYVDDPCRILTNDHSKPTTIHLTETSRESLLGFITTLGHIDTNDPIRLYSIGSSYRPGSEWFDGNSTRVSQSETCHALVLNSSIEAYSMKEYDRIKNIIWQAYEQIGLPTRLIHCSLDSMLTNEYDAHRVDIWMPSRNEWIEVGRISHYLDYLTVRTGMRRGHLIDSRVYDGQALFAAILENRQTALGKFSIPRALQEHLTALTKQEQENYCQDETSISSQKSVNSHQAPFGFGSVGGVINNYEQRRYFGKNRNEIYGHARDSWNKRRGGLSAVSFQKKVVIIVTGLFLLMLDIDEVWKSMVPDRVRAIIYDYVYRPLRSIVWNIKYANVPELRPNDYSYAEIEKPGYELTRRERFREQLLVSHYGIEGKEVIKQGIEKIKEGLEPEIDSSKPES